MAKQSWSIEDVNESIAQQRVIGQSMDELESKIKAEAVAISDSGIFELGATTRSVKTSFDLINATISKVGSKYNIIADTVDALNVRADEVATNNQAGALQDEAEKAKANTQFKL